MALMRRLYSFGKKCGEAARSLSEIVFFNRDQVMLGLKLLSNAFEDASDSR